MPLVQLLYSINGGHTKRDSDKMQKDESDNTVPQKDKMEIRKAVHRRASMSGEQYKKRCQTSLVTREIKLQQDSISRSTDWQKLRYWEHQAWSKQCWTLIDYLLAV